MDYILEFISKAISFDNKQISINTIAGVNQEDLCNSQ